jgi:protein-export membrane protein SecD/preprotein translocase SecF subunit
MRSKFNRYVLGFIVLLTVFSIVVVWPDEPSRYFGSWFPWPSGTGIHLGSFDRRAMRLGLDLRGGTRLVLQADTSQLDEEDVKNIDQRLDTAVGIIERRVNAFGVAESEIERQGTNRIAVALPGISPDEARSLVGRTAELQFKEVPRDPATQQPLISPDGTPQQWVPAMARDKNGELRPLTGRYLKANSYVTTDQAGLPAVAFEFNSEGGQMFGEITQRNIQLPLGIFLDDELVSAPRVNARIEDKGTITGVSAKEAKQLVAQLNAGALPVPFTIVQQTEIDATLGSDAVRQSVIAGEVGFIVVVLFMVLLYQLPGVIASLALIVYSATMLMIFKLLPVTLTLAGIAAFVLSIGMAVDANILIFERMKEEMRGGASLYTAIERGFSRAWTSIRDSNVSTMITAFILWWFGDQFGAALVKGFALTLGIGVLVSMFSSIWVTRTFLRLTIGTPLARHLEWWGMKRPEMVNGVPVQPPPRRLPAILQFVGHRRWWFLVSLLVMVPGIISLLIPPSLKPGIEFTSGTTFTLRFAAPPSQQAIRETLAGLGYADERVQKTSDGDFVIRTRELAGSVATPAVGPAPPSELDTIVIALRDRFGEVTVLESDTVSAIVSREIVQKATWAVLIATGAILVYISWAFRSVKQPIRYGVCAIAALLHDVVVVLGVFSILGKLFNVEINTLFITGLLTVIGFSVHDTIVVFDRIRENLRRNISPSFDDTVNQSLLQTLGRSLTTSLTVIFTLLALLLFGGSTIRTFILVLLIGIASGTYSSIFVASQLLVEWEHGTFTRPFQPLLRRFRRAPAPAPERRATPA